MRVLPAFALASALFLGACQNPDGSVNLPATLALGAGAAIAGVAIASANDGPRHRSHYRDDYYGRRSYGYSRPYYGNGYGHPHRGYRRW
jgi:nitrous oxide reductase accessory protein NosL